MNAHDRPGSAAGPRPPGTAGVCGYAMMLPAGWARIPLLHGSRTAIAGLVDGVLARAAAGCQGADLAASRAELWRHLTEMTREARAHAAIELYLPASPVRGAAVPAAIMVSRGSPGRAGLPEVQPAAGTGPGEGRPVTVDGAAGIRLERPAGPLPARGIPCGSYRAGYMLPVPGAPGDWLIITFSALDDGSRSTGRGHQLVGLFDAIMSTFRWTRH